MYLPSNIDGSWQQAEHETSFELSALTTYFPTPRSAVDYIMDSFVITKKRDLKVYGKYRTKDEILNIYDQMQEAMQGKPLDL